MIFLARLVALALLLLTQLGGWLVDALRRGRAAPTPWTGLVPVRCYARKDPRYAIARGPYPPFLSSTVLHC